MVVTLRTPGALLLGATLLLACNSHLGSSPGVGLDGSAAPPDAPVGPIADAASGPPDAAPPADAAPCVEGDDRVVGTTTGHCYIYFAAPATWYDARAACEAIGAHLVVSTSQQENDDFSPLAGLLDVFVGGTDAPMEGVWIWIDAEPMGYTNWRTGEPNNGGTNGEDCMVIEGDNGGLWDDRACDNTYGYICERE